MFGFFKSEEQKRKEEIVALDSFLDDHLFFDAKDDPILRCEFEDIKNDLKLAFRASPQTLMQVISAAYWMSNCVAGQSICYDEGEKPVFDDMADFAAVIMAHAWPEKLSGVLLEPVNCLQHAIIRSWGFTSMEPDDWKIGELWSDFKKYRDDPRARRFINRAKSKPLGIDVTNLVIRDIFDLLDKNASDSEITSKIIM